MSNVLGHTAQDVAALSMLRKAGLLVLVLAALVSLAQGVRNAQRFSQDFQWSPTVLFVKGENPYSHSLEGNQDGAIILSQEPNYAHGLYVLLAPFAVLSWGPAKLLWSCVNVLAGLFVAWWLGRHAGLRGIMLGVLVLAFVCSTPFRNNLANGQHAVLSLLAASAILATNTVRGSLLSGFAYFKYSFAPPLAAYLLFRRGPKYLLLSLVPGLLGYAIFLAYIGGDAAEVLTQPLKVGVQTFLGGPHVRSGGGGDGDLMSLASELFAQREGALFVFGLYVFPLCVSTGVALIAAKRVVDPLAAFAIVCVVSLLCFKHLRYDYVFLLPAFAYALAHLDRMPARIALGAIALDWYVVRLFDPSGLLHFAGAKQAVSLLVLTLCVVVIACLFLVHAHAATLRSRIGPAAA